MLKIKTIQIWAMKKKDRLTFYHRDIYKFSCKKKLVGMILVFPVLYLLNLLILRVKRNKNTISIFESQAHM